MKEYITIPTSSGVISELVLSTLAGDVLLCDDKKTIKAMRKVARYYTPGGISLAEWEIRGRPCNQEY